MRALVLTLLVGGLAIGCQSTTKEATQGPATKAPEQTAKNIPPDKTAGEWVKVRAANFEMELPKSWVAIDLSRKDFADTLASLAVDPGMKEQLKLMAQQGIFKLMAFGPTVTGGFQENVNVNVIPVPEPDLQKVLAGNMEQLKAVAKNVKGRIEKNPDRTVIDATMSAQGPDGKVVDYETHAHQIVKAGNLYTVTFSCMLVNRAATEKMAAHAIGTLKID